MLKFVKPTLDQEWEKPTGTAGAEKSRPENGAANGAKGANGSDVTPLFARAVNVEGLAAAPPLDTSVRSEIQRVRLDLLARETERLQQKLQLILEERRSDRAVIDALRSQIEDLTRQGLRMASRSETGEVEAGGDPELEKRIKPLLHTLLRMLERAKKDPPPATPNGVHGAPPLSEPAQAEKVAGSGEDAWSQIDATRKDDAPKEDKDEAKAVDQTPAPRHEPAPAPWDESDDSDDIPRIDEGFVEIAKLLRSPGPGAKAPEPPAARPAPAKPAPARPERAKAALPPSKETVKPATAKPATTEPATAKAAPPRPRIPQDKPLQDETRQAGAQRPASAAQGAPEPETSGTPAKAEPLLLGTDKTPQVKAEQKSQAPRAAVPTPRTEAAPETAPAAKMSAPRPAEPGALPGSRPSGRKAGPALKGSSREVTLRRAAAIADRFGGLSKAQDARRSAGKVQARPAPKAETAGASERLLKAKPEDRSITETPERSRAVTPSSAPSDVQRRVEARAAAIAARTAQRRKMQAESEVSTPAPQAKREAPPKEDRAREDRGKESRLKESPDKEHRVEEHRIKEDRVEEDRVEEVRGKLDLGQADRERSPAPKPDEAKKPNGSLPGLENDPLRAALPKCLTEPWDEGERSGLGVTGRSGALRWPFRKKKGGKAGGASATPRRGQGED